MVRITLAEREAQIRRKLAEGVRLPPPGTLANTGRRRTESKRALLVRLARQRRPERD